MYEIIKICDVLDLNYWERYYQDYFDVLNKGLNCKLTETNDKSGRMSEYSKSKMSLAQKGNKKTLGLKRSQKQKDEISKRMTGNIPWNIGVKRTKEELCKMSINRKGKMIGENNHLSNLIINLQTGIFYFGIKEASDSFDGNYNKMRDRLNGKTKNKTDTDVYFK